jgi:hypothetical protein
MIKKVTRAFHGNFAHSTLFFQGISEDRSRRMFSTVNCLLNSGLMDRKEEL